MKMATYNDVTIQDADTNYTAGNRVNGGTAIAMFCTSMSYSSNTHFIAPQVPGKDPSSTTHSSLLPKGEQVGFESPTIKVAGVIDLNRYDTTSGAAPTNTISVYLLQQLLKCGHKLTVSDVFDSATSTPIYRISSLSGTFPSETLTTLSCAVTSLSIDTNPSDSKEGHLIHYTLGLSEVQ